MKAESVVAEIADSVEEISQLNDVIISVMDIFEFFSLKSGFVLDFYQPFYCLAINNNYHCFKKKKESKQKFQIYLTNQLWCCSLNEPIRAQG